MRQAMQQLGRLVAVLALGSTLAMAQDQGFGTTFKLRAGEGVGTEKDNMTKRTLAFGLELGYQTTWGRVAAELGYLSKPGDQQGNRFANVVLPTGQTLNLAKSGEITRNSLEGVTLRLSYSNAFKGTDFGWAAGIQVGGARFRHEYIADIQNTAGTWRDTFNGTPTKTVMTPSPFVGVTYKINDASSVEVNLIALSYTAIAYQHVAGTVLTPTTIPAGYSYAHTGADTLIENKRVNPHLEIAYAFRF